MGIGGQKRAIERRAALAGAGKPGAEVIMAVWILTVWLVVIVAGESARALILVARPSLRESESWGRISRWRWWVYAGLLVVMLLNQLR